MVQLLALSRFPAILIQVGTSARYALNRTKYLLPPEVRRLEDLIKSYQDKDTRNVLLLWTGLKTGARASELLQIRRIDLNDYDQTVFIRGIKGSNDREIPLAHDLYGRLRRYSATLDTELIFPIGYHRLHQIWELYRPIPKKFHALRHTFAIQVYQKTKDIRLVQTALGHRNIMNTMIYADYVYTQEEMKKIL